MSVTARRPRVGSVLLVGLLGLAWLSTPSSAAASETQTSAFPAVADTYLDSSRPSTVLGASTGMDVDGSPATLALVRFDLSALAGRAVTGLRLRMHQVDASKVGGRVHAVSATAWSEASTWSSRPAVDPAVLATYGAVQAGSWYEVALDPALARAGAVAFALDTASSDGARWATRESASRPELLVTSAARPATQDPDGTTQVAGADRGSSEPTYYSGNHRLVVTRAGRTLALHGLHASGVQLTWRDAGGTWQTRSTGASSDGEVLTGTGTGDWPASLALATDASGVERAWVVWSGPNSGGLRPVQLRRLTDLDASGGPRLGPVVTVDPAPRGAYKADLAFERGADGVVRGCVLYSRRVSDTSYELVGSWFSDLTTDSPTFGSRTVLETTTSSAHHGSLVATSAGLRAVTRAGSGGGSLRLYAHDAAAALTTWSTGATGPALPSGSSPNAAALSSGEVVAVAEDDLSAHATTVYRFSASGTAGSALLRTTGLAQPTVVSDGTRVWLIAVRVSDGALVSRSWSASAGWTTERVETAAGAAGPYAWPAALRQADGRLRLLLEGPGSSSSRSSVWAYQRLL